MARLEGDRPADQLQPPVAVASGAQRQPVEMERVDVLRLQMERALAQRTGLSQLAGLECRDGAIEQRRNISTGQ